MSRRASAPLVVYRVRPSARRRKAERVNESTLLALHRAANARLRDDAAPVLTYGDVPSEYRAGMEGALLFDATDRGAIEVSGADAASFLHRLLSNDVRNLEDGRSQRDLLLSSKGKVLHDFELARERELFRISTTPGTAKALMTALDTYLFSEKVKLADSTATHAPLELCGPAAEATLRKAFNVELPARERAYTRGEFAGAPLVVTRVPIAGSPGFRVDAGPQKSAELWNALVSAGARPGGIVARDILRVEAGRAEPGADIDENVYPQEARLEEAFSLEKGCYIGQEVVAKIDTYGGLNKRLVALKIVHDDPIARGTRLYRQDEGEWRDLGVVTSWAYSFVLDTGLVLAYVKRRHQKPGTELRVGDGPATATIVPIPVRANAVPVTGEFE
jgi:folate-binding protein YgfZ